MALTSDEVRHVALLARVGLTPEEVELYRSQLDNVLNQFQSLQELDTVDVPPTSQSIPLETVLREDEPRQSLPKEEVMANAPRREGDFFRVRAVLE